MTAIAAVSNGDSGSSVRTKLNSTITLVNANNLADLREAMVDADKTFTAGFREVYLSVALTGAKILTLPAASAFPAGTELIFVDEIGGITSTNTVAVTRAGADTINGSATAFTLYSPNVVFKLITDGSSKWTGGVVTTTQNGTYQTDWTPTYTGFSANPTSVTSRYILIGKMCTVYLAATSGTSNTTAKTITLPFAAANTAVQTFPATITNNGTIALGRVGTRVNSNVADVYATIAAGAWTASGTCNIQFAGLTYEIA